MVTHFVSPADNYTRSVSEMIFSIWGLWGHIILDSDMHSCLWYKILNFMETTNACFFTLTPPDWMSKNVSVSWTCLLGDYVVEFFGGMGGITVQVEDSFLNLEYTPQRSLVSLKAPWPTVIVRSCATADLLIDTTGWHESSSNMKPEHLERHLVADCMETISPSLPPTYRSPYCSMMLASILLDSLLLLKPRLTFFCLSIESFFLIHFVSTSDCRHFCLFML